MRTVSGRDGEDESLASFRLGADVRRERLGLADLLERALARILYPDALPDHRDEATLCWRFYDALTPSAGGRRGGAGVDCILSEYNIGDA
jgi:hypothetical protein